MLSTIMLAWFVAAEAAVPTKVATVLAPDATPLDKLGSSQDGLLHVVPGGDDGVLVVDAGSWTTSLFIPPTDPDDPLSNCSVRSADAWIEDGTSTVFIGCSDGTVAMLTWDGTTLSQTDVAPVDVGDNPVVALFADGSQIYVMLSGSGGTARPVGAVLTWSASTLAVANDGSSLGAFPQGFNEAAAITALDGTVQRIETSHGDDSSFSSWIVASGAVQNNNNGQGSQQVDPYDIAARTPQGAWIADRGGVVAHYNGQNLSSIVPVVPDAGAPQAISEWTQDDVTSLLVYDADAREVAVYPVTGGTPTSSFESPTALTDLVEAAYGYAVGVGDGGIAVLTANPWIEGLTADPTTVVEGTTVDVTFSVDSDCAWSLHRGGDRTGSGDEIASGTASADDNVSASFVVDDSWSEGTESLWVVAVGDGTGLRGSARLDLDVDNPPGALSLPDNAIGFGDRKIVVDFRGLSDEDIDTYRIYLSTAPFVPADYPASGGPTAKIGSITPPVVLKTEDNSLRVSGEIKPLVNGVTYYVAVRAFDGTLEGPMSRVFQVTPRKTFGAAGLDDETGGCALSTTGQAGGLWLGLVGLAGLALRRRRAGAWVAMLGLAGLALVPSTARAQQVERSVASLFERDQTPAWAVFEFQGGSFQFDSATIQTVYASGAANLRLAVGVQIFRYAEITAGLGYLWTYGKTVDTSGASSLEDIQMEWLPMELELRARIHVIDEQPFVPFAKIGLDMVPWHERPLDADGFQIAANGLGGTKFGWHWGAGGQILLDLLAPQRASMLEANTGINDTWLTVEYRQQYVGQGGTGLDLSGWSVTGGIKIDY